VKVVLQRCTSACVKVEGQIVGEIGPGWVAFVGVEAGDGEEQARKLSEKVAGLRMFDDAEGRFNLSVRDVNGSVLAISNFTLCGDTKKGMRPSFSRAAPPDGARELFETFVTLLRASKVPVSTGTFGAHMAVNVENDGPVTLILEVKSTTEAGL
jgi:D-tyrosyl-tRNA(Tyr) deacylase